MYREKNEATLLKEKLFIGRKNGGKVLPDEEIQKAEEFSKGYKIFLNKSKTERESVSCLLKKAVSLGFVKYDKTETYKPGDKVYHVNRDRGMVLAVMGKNGVKNGIKMAVAHIDAPRLDLKPNPLMEKNDLALFKTHYYGGIKKYQWTTIPLALHGRVVKKDGSFADMVIGEEEGEPCFCVSDLLPHLAREQMGKKMSEAITGEDLNVLVGSVPFRGGEGSELVKLNILKLFHDKYGIVEEDFVSADLELVPALKARDVGFDRSMIGAYAQDDRSCVYACAQAMFNCDIPEETIITVLTDKEEIGSDGNTGMKSGFVQYFISDLAAKENMKGYEVLSLSKCLSADVNAAFDPTYSSVFEPANSSFMNQGVVVTKYTGSGGKSGTSDASAEFTGEVLRAFNEAGVLWQGSELGRIDAGGGGTIAKYIANLNVEVIDIGVPVLSMHAPFEVVSKIDLYMTYRAVEAFFGKYSVGENQQA